jgi:hypothetical protein
MINSFLTKSKIMPNHTKFTNINSICQRERKYNNGNYDAHILRNIRQKKLLIIINFLQITKRKSKKN